MNHSDRIFNFSAGPSMLPVPVLERCNREMFNCNGSGMSVMEMSHRSKPFMAIAAEAEALLREVMSIPDNYKVLFMQGGASLQFSAVPINLRRHGSADYIRSGNFSTVASNEAAKFIGVHIAGSSEETNFDHTPMQEELTLDPEADYLHLCLNNTIYGTKFPYLPKTSSGVPLVADISSCLLSEPLDVSKFGLLYAGVQKNLAPAGMALVIIRDDLLRDPSEDTPLMLNYKLTSDKDSMYNTPNCWSIYVTGLVLDYLKNEIGGLGEMQKINQKKAALLYDYLDSEPFYTAGARKDCRSLMNVIFRTQSAELDEQFVKGASQRGMVSLKGHRVLGGMRASIYNNMPYEGVEALVRYLEQFAATNR